MIVAQAGAFHSAYGTRLKKADREVVHVFDPLEKHRAARLYSVFKYRFMGSGFLRNLGIMFLWLCIGNKSIEGAKTRAALDGIAFTRGKGFCMKILVTGGAGFIGSHVVDAYIKEGHDVMVVDDLSSGKLENINPKAIFHKLDIRSKEAREVILREKPDIINHHAAQMSVPRSVQDPFFDADVNVRGLLNVLEAAKDSGVKKVVFISSGGAIYGEVGKRPATENSSIMPLSPYAVTKAAGENYLFFYKNQYGLDFIVLRYANVYGPRQIPHGEAGVVAIFMERLLLGKPCIVYGFPDEPKGIERDYCYVGDESRVNVLALKHA